MNPVAGGDAIRVRAGVFHGFRSGWKRRGPAYPFRSNYVSGWIEILCKKPRESRFPRSKEPLARFHGDCRKRRGTASEVAKKGLSSLQESQQHPCAKALSLFSVVYSMARLKRYSGKRDDSLRKCRKIFQGLKPVLYLVAPRHDWQSPDAYCQGCLSKSVFPELQKSCPDANQLTEGNFARGSKKSLNRSV